MFPKHRGTILENNFRAAMERREVRRFEIPGRYTNAWYRMTAYPSEEGITVHGMDITENKRSEQALLENQANLQSFYDSAPFMMGITELDGDRSVLVSGNRSLADFFKRELADMLGQHSSALGTPPAIEHLWVENYRKSQEQRKPIRFEYEYPQRGAGRWFQATVSFITIGPAGRPRFSFVTENITERKRAEQALAQALQELHAHLDNSPLAIVTFDREFRIVEWSAGASRMFGWHAEEMLGKQISEVRWVHEEDAERVAGLSADMLAGLTPSNVHANRNYCKDGSVIECEAIVAAC